MAYLVCYGLLREKDQTKGGSFMRAQSHRMSNARIHFSGQMRLHQAVQAHLTELHLALPQQVVFVTSATLLGISLMRALKIQR
jgi:hypothetical protein